MHRRTVGSAVYASKHCAPAACWFIALLGRIAPGIAEFWLLLPALLNAFV